MLHSFFIQMAPPVLLFYTTSITFFYYKLTTPLFFRSSSSAKRERASQAPAVSSCCNCLRLQEPLHPLEILHKLQRSSCFFQPLKSSRPEKSRLLKLTNARRRQSRRRRLACLSTSAWPSFSRWSRKLPIIVPIFGAVLKLIS